MRLRVFHYSELHAEFGLVVWEGQKIKRKTKDRFGNGSKMSRMHIRPNFELWSVKGGRKALRALFPAMESTLNKVQIKSSIPMPRPSK